MSTLNAVGDFRLDQVVAKTLMTPGGSSSPGVAPEIFPCIVLENDRPEYHYLYGAMLYGRGTSVAAGGAGTRSSVTLVNQSQETLAVIERVQLTVASGAATIRLSTGFTGFLPFGTVLRGVARDTRSRATSGTVPQNSQLAFVTDNTLGAGGSSTLWFSALTLDLREPFVLGPGGALVLQPSADNVAIDFVSVLWRERRLNPSERL